MFTVEEIKDRLFDLQKISAEKDCNQKFMEAISSESAVCSIWINNPVGRSFDLPVELSDLIKPVILEYLKTRENYLISKAHELMK